jgi:hypothetical protein
MNYETGEYECPDFAWCTGDKLGTGEYIFLPSECDVRFEVDNRDTVDWYREHDFLYEYSDGMQGYRISFAEYDSDSNAYSTKAQEKEISIYNATPDSYEFSDQKLKPYDEVAPIFPEPNCNFDDICGWDEKASTCPADCFMGPLERGELGVKKKVKYFIPSEDWAILLLIFGISLLAYAFISYHVKQRRITAVLTAPKPSPKKKARRKKVRK